MGLSGLHFLTFLIAIVLYHTATEGYTGTSPGKRLLSLQVSRSDGSRPSWTSIAIRNSLRLVDIMPGLYLVGMVAIWSTKTNQRLGDLAASTMVHPILGSDDEMAMRPLATPLLIGAAALTLAVGAGLIAAGPPALSLGGVPVDPVVDEFVTEAVEAIFVPLDLDALYRYGAPELAELDAVEPAFETHSENPGPLIGSYSVVDVAVGNWTLPNGTIFAVAEYLIEGEFRDGRTQLSLAIVNRNGELQIVAWHLGFA